MLSSSPNMTLEMYFLNVGAKITGSFYLYTIKGSLTLQKGQGEANET